MGRSQTGKSGGARKIGRNMEKCKRYRMAGKHELGHIFRIKKHQKTYKDNSPMVINALGKYQELLKRV